MSWDRGFFLRKRDFLKAPSPSFKGSRVHEKRSYGKREEGTSGKVAAIFFLSPLPPSTHLLTNLKKKENREEGLPPAAKKKRKENKKVNELVLSLPFFLCRQRSRAEGKFLPSPPPLPLLPLPLEASSPLFTGKIYTEGERGGPKRSIAVQHSIRTAELSTGKRPSP